MKKILFSKYKCINLLLFIITSFIVVVLYEYIEKGYCLDKCSIELKKGVINPIFMGGKWLAGILGVLLFVPANIFRKWLFYVAPVVVCLTVYLVSNISVYSTNLLNPTRGKMAENGMIALAVITVVFVGGHLLNDRMKKNKVIKKTT